MLDDKNFVIMTGNRYFHGYSRNGRLFYTTNYENALKFSTKSDRQIYIIISDIIKENPTFDNVTLCEVTIENNTKYFKEIIKVDNKPF